MNVEPYVKAPSPRPSPRSSPRSLPPSNVLPVNPQAEDSIVKPLISPKGSVQEKNELRVTLPSAAVEVMEQTPSDDYVNKVEENNHQELVEEFDQRDSVEAFSNRDSVEQYDSMISQDRGSDLTLEETDQENLYDSNPPHESSSSSSAPSPYTDATTLLQLQKQQNDENNAFEYLREICSPTVSYSLQSDQWGHRKEALELIQKYIERNQPTLKSLSEDQCCVEFKWFCIILKKYFIDRVAPVFYAAYDCFRALLKVYSSYIHGSQEIEEILESMIGPLLSNLGGEIGTTGTNKRTQKEACRCILRIARLTAVDGLRLILQMFQDSSSSSSSGGGGTSSHTTSSLIGIKQKLILLKILINEFTITESSNGNHDSGISTDLVLSICQIGINHTDDKIRKSAVDIMGIAYQQVGKNIKMFITDIKPAMLKVLEKKFSEIDAMNGTNNSTTASTSSVGVGTISSLNHRDSFSENTVITSSTKSKSKKVENIRNLAPVVLMKSSSGSGSFNGGGGGGVLGGRNLNSSFSGTAMVSTNPDGEENFVVMKSPSMKGLATGGLPPASVHEKKSLSRIQNPATGTGTGPSSSSSSSMETDKENDSQYLMTSSKRIGAAGIASVGNGNGGGGSRSRFEISDEISSSSASSPMIKKKTSSSSSSGKGIKPQPKNVPEDRFCIDESQF
jgi:hypothetical protein